MLSPLIFLIFSLGGKNFSKYLKLFFFDILEKKDSITELMLRNIKVQYNLICKIRP